MSRSARFLGGLSFGYLNQAAATLIGLWITPFLFHRIGPANYGLWLVASQVLLYLTLMDFGVIALLPRELAFRTGRAGGWERSDELPGVVGEVLRLLLWQMPFVALVSAAVWFAMSSPEWAPLRNPLGAALAAFTLLFPLRIFYAVLLGLQDLAYAGKAQVCVAIVTPLASAALVYAGAGMASLAIAWASGQAVLAALCWRRVRARFPGVMPSKVPALDWAAAKEWMRRGFWVTVSQLAQVLLNGTDVVIIARLFGPAAVVPYAFTGKLITVLANQPQMLMHSAGPALSEMRAGEPAERQLLACNALSQATMLISGAVACVVMVVNRGFVTWWTGAGQYGGFALCVLLLANMLLRHWNNPLVFTVFCFGGERRLALTTLFDGLLTFGGSLVFLRFMGVAGAPVAGILGVCAVSLPFNLGKLAAETGKPVWALMMPLRGWFLRFVPLMAIAGAISRVWTPTNVFSLAGATAAMGLTYAIVMWSAALSDPLGVYLRPRVAALRARVFRLPAYV